MSQKTLKMYQSGEKFDIEIKETSQVGVADVDGVYVSHLHADHIGGLEEMAFCTYFNPAAPKPKMYGNFRLMHDLWEQSLRGGLESIQAKQMDLDSYFDVMRIPDNGEFIWEGIGFKPVQTVHVVNDCTINVSYSLLIRDGMKWTLDKKDAVNISNQPEPIVFFTTDTQFCPNQISDFYAKADIVFHDCENSPFKSGIHSHYNELAMLDSDVKKKMVLYHYQITPNQEETIGDRFLDIAYSDKIYDISWDSVSTMNAKLTGSVE